MRPHRVKPTIAALLVSLTALFAACSDSSAPDADTLPNQVVIGAVDTLRSISATAQLSSSVKNSKGEPISGAAVQWQSVNPAVATVNAAGLVKAVSNGSAYIRATSTNAVDSILIVVLQRIDPSRSTITAARPLVFVDDTVGLTLQARDALGSPINFGGADVLITRIGTGTILPTVDRGDGTYTTSFVGAALGTTTDVTARINGTQVSAAAVTLKVVGFTEIAAYSSGLSLTCGIITTGDLYCWGEPGRGVRGTGAVQEASFAPTRVSGGHQWSDVGIANEHVCGIGNGKLYCWGNSINGALGNGASTGTFPAPVAILPESSFVALDLHVVYGNCAITIGQSAVCWGIGDLGRLGNGADTTVYRPVAVRGGYRFAAIATSSSGTCGVTDTGTAMCWGFELTLGIGSGSSPDTCSAVFLPCAKTPVRVAGTITFKPILAHDGGDVCGTGTNDKTYCWGMWDKVPTELVGAPVFVSLTKGLDDTCGIGQSGIAYCWGTNSNGRFGSPRNGGEVHRVPEPVPGGKLFTQLAMATFHTCGIAPDGNAWCWGTNFKGVFGDPLTPVSSTIVVPSTTAARVRLFSQ